jgi:hypothetical protein
MSAMENEKIYIKIKDSCETIFRNKYSIYDHDTIYDSILSLIVQYKKNSVAILISKVGLLGLFIITFAVI